MPMALASRRWVLEAPGVQVVEVGWGPSTRTRHLPGAVFLDTNVLETGYPAWRLRPLRDVQRELGGLGIRPDRPVALYGDWLLAVARAWWVLRWAGCADVRVLPPGEVEAAALSPTLSALPPARFVANARDELLVTTADVLARLGEVTLADVRTHAEYLGETSGYQSLVACGRIPESEWWGDVGSWVSSDGGLLPLDDVRARWPKPRPVIFLCGGGWRSSLACLYAHLLGWPDVRHYSDGWFGYSTRFIPDPQAGEPTPGWRQDPTGYPSVKGAG